MCTAGLNWGTGAPSTLRTSTCRLMTQRPSPRPSWSMKLTPQAKTPRAMRTPRSGRGGGCAHRALQSARNLDTLPRPPSSSCVRAQGGGNTPCLTGVFKTSRHGSMTILLRGRCALADAAGVAVMAQCTGNMVNETPVVVGGWLRSYSHPSWNVTCSGAPSTISRQRLATSGEVASCR
jgi:hypothetical protein